MFRTVALAIALLFAVPASAGPPAVGEPAPPFRLLGPGGLVVEGSDFRGVRGVVVAWFPRAFTPG